MLRKTLVLILSASFLSAPLMAQVSEDHSLNRVWTRMADIMGEYGSVESAELSPNSEFIVTGSKYDNTVRAWRTEDGFMLWKTTLPAEIERVAWTADNETVVSVSEDHYMRVIDAATGEILKEIQHDYGLDSAALSRSGKLMAIGEEMRAGSEEKGATNVVLYDTETWEEVLKVDQVTTANEIDFTPDDRYFVVVGSDHMRLWETATGRLVKENVTGTMGRDGFKHGFVCTKISPDGKHIAVGGSRGNLYLFDATNGEFIRAVNKTGQKIETVEWTKDGRYVLTAGREPVIDFYSTEHVLDTSLNNGAVPIAKRVHVTDQLEYMNFNSTGALLTTAHQDGTVQLWTYMSDVPGINQRSHSALSAMQQKEFHEKPKE